MKTEEQLKAEFLDQQLWQFISLDEWLDAHRRKTPDEVTNP